ncbi:alpha-galactosidase [Sphaerochaeta sp. PS]|uniref:alpha-galactosidase n=1 Tax=Sphaerochaeta sp. PS TaxID=3076336 RepID=UPI0028A3290E|nr:alpha-galactosidase [Sphaerochaeta sp. PS]MDT4763086.1 alpha-galactosidase [Sphaerochaeta sp. PS]
MISKKDQLFNLSTNNTTYLFAITETGHLEHLYYGKKISSEGISHAALAEKRSLSIGTGTAYSSDNPTLFLGNLCLEYSSMGKGDCRESFVDIEYGRGMQTLDFVVKSFRIIPGKPRTFSGLPESYGDKSTCTTLEITLKESGLPIRLVLTYTTFEDSDVITRRSAIYNDSDRTITIRNLASLQLDLDGDGWNLVTFDGAWARERYMHERPLSPGIIINDSKTGVSSAEHNPCIFLTNEDGECIGTNLIYSGNHREVVETSPYGKIRLLTGINPSQFSWDLGPQDRFQSPEAILTFSPKALNGASQNFHHFVNNHIIRGEWKFRERPVLVNNWEATYFNFTEDKLISLAREASSLGAELFVLDDGWFGIRNDDTTSLGDWTVNPKKLPSGLGGLALEIHRMGMMFGLWVEPEMVSIESQLYKKHPDWMVAIPGRKPSVGRNQYLLDLTRSEVRDYLFKMLSDTWHLADVNYIKWDMNRTFSDLYSSNKEIKNHGEFLHRYVLGLYELLSRLTTAFPNVLFESCASGGNRFDLGMLCFMPQTWTSDNTDALCRLYIQEGTSCGYPLSTMGSHVSTSPNHQTLRKTDLEARFNVASFGVLGYELDLTKLNRQQKEAIRSQISFYKANRSLLQYGTFTRVKWANRGANHVVWAVASGDRSTLLVLFAQKLNQSNPGSDRLKIEAVDLNATYEVFPRQQKIDIRTFGDLVNRISPLAIAEGGLAQDTLSKALSFDSEVEHYRVSGELLANAGIKLNQQFGGTGYDGETRVLGDFGSRIYICKKID